MFSLYLYQTWNKYDMQWVKNDFFSFCAIIKENVNEYLIFEILIKFMETHSATWWTSFYSSSEFSHQTGVNLLPE